MSTIMEKEAREMPDCVAKQWRENQAEIEALAKRVQAAKPSFALTVARGSSDHAATFAKYLFETKLGLITATAAPSTVTLYRSDLQLKNSLVVGISQSGKSPDICEVMKQAKEKGAITVAIVNVVDSPLANLSDFVLPLHVGEEKAVAATKSYIGSLTSLIQMTAILANDQPLLTAMEKLPDALQAAANQDWSMAIPHLEKAHDALVLARGYGFPIAQEAALKLKETSSIHAESFSGAEVLHGPFAVLSPGFPALMFTQNDASLTAMLVLAKKIKDVGAHLMLAATADVIATSDVSQAASQILALPNSLHPICDPLLSIQAFYPMAAHLAVKRGKNPDAPDNLKKVTETL